MSDKVFVSSPAFFNDHLCIPNNESTEKQESSPEVHLQNIQYFLFHDWFCSEKYLIKYKETWYDEMSKLNNESVNIKVLQDFYERL